MLPVARRRSCHNRQQHPAREQQHKARQLRPQLFDLGPERLVQPLDQAGGQQQRRLELSRDDEVPAKEEQRRRQQRQSRAQAQRVQRRLVGYRQPGKGPAAAAGAQSRGLSCASSKG
jgi:hypothetical protein